MNTLSKSPPIGKEAADKELLYICDRWPEISRYDQLWIIFKIWRVIVKKRWASCFYLNDE